MESDSGEMVFEITSELPPDPENLETNNNETKKRNDRRRNNSTYFGSDFSLSHLSSEIFN